MADVLNSTLPAEHAYEVTVHNTNAQLTTRGIYIGEGGDMKVTTVGGETVTYKDAPQGTVIPVCAVVIFDTGTTAASLVGMY